MSPSFLLYFYLTPHPDPHSLSQCHGSLHYKAFPHCVVPSSQIVTFLYSVPLGGFCWDRSYSTHHIWSWSTQWFHRTQVLITVSASPLSSLCPYQRLFHSQQLFSAEIPEIKLTPQFSGFWCGPCRGMCAGLASETQGFCTGFFPGSLVCSCDTVILWVSIYITITDFIRCPGWIAQQYLSLNTQWKQFSLLLQLGIK